MNSTREYTTIHRAFHEVARTSGLCPGDVRVLLAVADSGRAPTTSVLEKALEIDGGHLRRHVCVLREVGYIQGGGQRGRRSPIDLTDSGQMLVTSLRWAITRRNGR